MIRGIGVDACQIDRMAALLPDSSLLRRCFSQAEQVYIREKKNAGAASMAAMFAAKEAALKAFGGGLGSVPLPDITVLHHPSGQPYYALTGKAADLLGSNGCLHLSITHEHDLAIAFTVWEENA